MDMRLAPHNAESKVWNLEYFFLRTLNFLHSFEELDTVPRTKGNDGFFPIGLPAEKPSHAFLFPPQVHGMRPPYFHFEQFLHCLADCYFARFGVDHESNLIAFLLLPSAFLRDYRLFADLMGLFHA